MRAYGVEREMHDHFRDLLDANNRAYILFVHTSRWLGVRLDFAAALCLTTSALLSVLLRHKISPGYIGNLAQPVSSLREAVGTNLTFYHPRCWHLDFVYGHWLLHTILPKF